jgi:hypothetical protein
VREREVYYCDRCYAVESYTDDGGEHWFTPDGEETGDDPPSLCPHCGTKLSGASGDCKPDRIYKLLRCSVGREILN